MANKKAARLAVYEAHKLGEAARALRVPESTLRGAADRGEIEIETSACGSARMVRLEDVRAWLRAAQRDKSRPGRAIKRKGAGKHER